MWKIVIEIQGGEPSEAAVEDIEAALGEALEGEGIDDFDVKVQ